MAFVLEKTPKPGEPGRDFYDFIRSKVNGFATRQWIVDKERGIAVFYRSNNSRYRADEPNPIKFFTAASKDWRFGIHEEIFSTEKKSDTCLILKVKIQLWLDKLEDGKPEFWTIAEEAMRLYGDYGLISDYSEFELVLLNSYLENGEAK